jgi:hypothetical protein
VSLGCSVVLQWSFGCFPCEDKQGPLIGHILRIFEISEDSFYVAFFVYLRYLKILFTAVQCMPFGFEMNCANWFTAYEISGWLARIIYLETPLSKWNPGFPDIALETPLLWGFWWWLVMHRQGRYSSGAVKPHQASRKKMSGGWTYSSELPTCSALKWGFFRILSSSYQWFSSADIYFMFQYSNESRQLKLICT